MHAQFSILFPEFVSSPPNIVIHTHTHTVRVSRLMDPLAQAIGAHYGTLRRPVKKNTKHERTV